jgi:hypothetical protein
MKLYVYSSPEHGAFLKTMRLPDQPNYHLIATIDAQEIFKKKKWTKKEFPIPVECCVECVGLPRDEFRNAVLVCEVLEDVDGVSDESALAALSAAESFYTERVVEQKIRRNR